MPVTLTDNLETLEHLANNHPWLEPWLSLNPSNRYSVEPHGDGYALYYGRSDTAHGFRLCNLTELDPKRPDLPDLIEKALNDPHPESHVLVRHVEYEYTDIIGVMRSEAEALDLYRKVRQTHSNDSWTMYFVEVWKGGNRVASYGLDGDGRSNLTELDPKMPDLP